MKNDKIFTGTIMQCAKYKEVPDFIMADCVSVDTIGHVEAKEEVYKKNATLVKTKNGLYVDVDGLDILAIAYLYLENKKEVKSGEAFMISGSHGLYNGQLYVDTKSIKPFNTNEENISLLKLKRESTKK